MTFFHTLDGFWYADTLDDMPETSFPAICRIISTCEEYMMRDNGTWEKVGRWSGVLPSGVKNARDSVIANAGRAGEVAEGALQARFLESMKVVDDDHLRIEFGETLNENDMVNLCFDWLYIFQFPESMGSGAAATLSGSINTAMIVPDRTLDIVASVDYTATMGGITDSMKILMSATLTVSKTGISLKSLDSITTLGMVNQLVGMASGVSHGISNNRSRVVGYSGC